MFQRHCVMDKKYINKLYEVKKSVVYFQEIPNKNRQYFIKEELYKLTSIHLKQVTVIPVKRL